MDTIPADTSTTEVLLPGGSRTSTIDMLGDRDWFQVTLTGGFSYDIILEGTGSPTELGTVEYFIFDSSGNFITNEPDFNTVGFERNSFTPALDGIYYIAAAADNDNTTGDYILSLGNDDARNTVDTQQTISVGGSVTGTIDAFGDRDWYEITLDAGLTYQITLEGTGTATGLDRVEYQILDASGTLITTESDFGTSGFEENSFSPAGGTYYIAARGDTVNDLGDYVLSVGTDDVRNDVDTQHTIAPGGSVTGTIGAFGDRDWYEVELEAGLTYQITLEGAGTANDLSRVEYLIFNSSGTFIANEEDFGTGGFETNSFSPGSDGTYYIAASGDTNTDRGNYRLSVGTDDVRNDIDTQHDIAVGGSVTGTIGAFGDRDWYEIDLEAGFSYQITLEGAGTTNDLSRVEYLIFNSSGTFIANEEDFGTGGFETNSFSPASDGTYYIAASGDTGTDRGNYVLSVGTDDVRASVETEALLAVGEAVTGEIESFGDDDWYEIALVAGVEYTITLEGDGSSNSLGRVEFSVRDVTGTILLTEEDFGQSGIETAVFTSTQSGTYFIDASGDTTTDRGNYILSVEGDRPLNTGSNEDDVLVGDSADENFSGLAGEDTIVGGGGGDIAFGGADDDIIVGGEGNDFLYGEGGEDSLFGNTGNDILIGGAGADDLRGGSGSDTSDYRDATAFVRIDLANISFNRGDALGDTFSSIENVAGSAFADNIRGDDASNTLSGGDSDDTLIGREGDDTLIGGAGADTLTGGGDSDTAGYSDAATAVRADLINSGVNTGDAAGDTYSSIENLAGSDFDDDLRGDDSANVLIGGAGDDALRGRQGDDIFVGGAGADFMSGGSETDTVDYSGEAERVRVDLVDNTANSFAAAGDELVSIENLVGTTDNDLLRGNGEVNLLEGGDGNDIFLSRGGNDTLNGGAGDDVLIGGSGVDSFIFRTGDGNDEIRDFTDNREKLIFVDTGLEFSDLTVTAGATGAEIDYGSGVITMTGISVGRVTEDDFEFI